MGRPAGMPNLANLAGEPIQAEDGAWWVMVRPRTETNLKRWVSAMPFGTEKGAEDYWMLFRADVAEAKREQGRIFVERFRRTDDAKPKIAQRMVSSEGVVFHVKQREGRWYVSVTTPEGEWWAKVESKSKEYADGKRRQARKSSRNLIGQAWAGWLKRNYVKEGENGTVEK